MVLKPPVRMEFLSFFKFKYLPRTKTCEAKSQPSTSGNADYATDRLRFWKVGRRRQCPSSKQWNNWIKKQARGRGRTTVGVKGNKKGRIQWRSKGKARRWPQDATTVSLTMFCFDTRTRATNEATFCSFWRSFDGEPSQNQPTQEEATPKLSWVQ